mmetsp:Transcript_22623/g.49113  ORF Transcript_22623/g.49113 Transcript_22623/m.49113 type:complete len:190 (-) Transcript_22623:303-872(-)
MMPRILASLFVAAAAGSASAFTVQPAFGVLSVHHASSQAQKQPTSTLSSAHPLCFGGSSSDSRTAPLAMADSSNDTKQSDLPMLLDPGTKGGALFLSLVLFILPIIFYQVITNVFGYDPLDAGRYIGVGFTVVTTLLWVSTYIFRVATKDMTYAKQLKDYENAVIAKRLEELDEDEVQALVEDIERDDF